MYDMVRDNPTCPTTQNRSTMQPQAQPGTDVALPGGMATGLEDFGVEDLKLPRLSINHERGVFVDSLSKMEFSTLAIIPLGAIKQRVLWQPTVSEDKNASPLCKSTDYHTGYPTMNDPVVANNFPWQKLGWNPSDFPKTDEGRITLPCGSCPLKDWGSHPVDNKKTWCTEQHAIPMLYAAEGQEPGMTALWTAQRSSINASKGFFASIMRRQLPAFAVYAKVSLTPHVRGRNTFYVPIFQETGFTDQANWMIYSESLMSIRTFVSQPPRRKEDNALSPQGVAQSNQNPVIQGNFQNNTWAPGNDQNVQQGQPVQQQYSQPAPVYAQPVPQPVQQAVPQFTPPMPPQPVMQPPVQQAPVQQAPVQQAPVQQAPAPVAQPQPVLQPPVQQAPASPVNPVPQGPSSARDADDDLPF